MSPLRSVHRYHRRSSSIQKGKGKRKRKRQPRHPKKSLVKHRRHPQKRHTRSKKRRSHQRGGFFLEYIRDNNRKIDAAIQAIKAANVKRQ
jgi:hypothetical protein